MFLIADAYLIILVHIPAYSDGSWVSAQNIQHEEREVLG